MKRKISVLTKKYSISQAYYWTVFMIILEFSGIFLTGSGISNSQIGLLLALSGLLAAILQPVVASQADKPKSPSIKTYLYVLASFMILFSLLLLIRFHHTALLLLTYGGWIIILEIMAPFHHSIGTESINQNKNIDIGFTRGIASIVCGILSFFLGSLADHYGIRILPLTVLVLMALYLINIFRFPFSKTDAEDGSVSPAKADRYRLSDLFSFFIKYKRFSVSLIGCTLLYMSQILTMNFMYQVTAAKGGGYTEAGFALGIAALSELPVMFGFIWLIKKRSAGHWVMAAGFFYIAKALGTLLVGNVGGLYAVQFLHMTSWALLSVAVIYYVNDVMETTDTIKGQAYMAATYSIAVVIGSLAGGLILDQAGVPAMLLVSVIAATTGTILNLLSVPSLLRKK